jgi:hypothetical protein
MDIKTKFGKIKISKYKGYFSTTEKNIQQQNNINNMLNGSGFRK